MKDRIVLGIDIGGTGMKGALVNVRTGELMSERHRIPTPQPASPKSMAATLREIVEHFNWKGPIGCGFPAVVQRCGSPCFQHRSALDWGGCRALFSEAAGQPVRMLNDADAAGLASARFGAGKDVKGVCIFITVGTGIGSAIFTDGKLVPNTELGQLYLKNHKKVAEKYCSNSVRTKEELSWEVWGRQFNRYLNKVYQWFYPNKIIVGGGQSKRWEEFAAWIDVPCETIPAELQNNAGIIGAAMAAE
ncbi:MAG: ROK family protein [Bacteroidia bacterium]